MDSSFITIVLKLLAVLFLVLANGFFVATEFSLVTLRRTRIEQLVSEGNGGARVIERIMQNPNRLLSATQLGVTMASLALGWVGEPTLAQVIVPALEWIPGEAIQPVAHTIATIIAFAGITYFHIVIGELAPKSMALQRTEGTAMAIARPIDFFLTIFRPIIWVLNWSGRAVLNAFGLTGMMGHEAVHSEEELKMILNASQEGGVLEPEETRMLHRVFAFTDTPVRHVMIPRTEMASVPADADMDEVLQLIEQTGHTRLPVYEKTPDNIIGMVHSKDLLHLLNHPLTKPFNLRDFLREIYSVPEGRPIDDVLAEMRRRRVQMMVIIDEYGGTAGLVTLEDLLEEIVGDVEDEFDPNAPQSIAPQPDGSTLVDGLLTLDDVNERFGLGLESEDYDTIGGIIFGLLGRKPELGDEVRLDGYLAQVAALDGLRIATVRLIPRPKTATEPVANEETT